MCVCVQFDNTCKFSIIPTLRSIAMLCGFGLPLLKNSGSAPASCYHLNTDNHKSQAHQQFPPF